MNQERRSGGIIDTRLLTDPFAPWLLRAAVRVKIGIADHLLYAQLTRVRMNHLYLYRV